MTLSGPALRLTVLVGESDQWHHRPVFAEVVHRAHEADLAGATVLRGVESFGSGHQIHTSRLLSLGDDLPVMILLIDTEERIRAFLPQVEEVVAEGLVMIDRCEVVRHVPRTRRANGTPASDEAPDQP